MADEVYCYPGTDIMKNIQNVRSPKQLLELEKRLTMLRILELLDTPVDGAFDFKHLQAIHRYIFQDVYQWAGEIRKVNIAKGNMFCNVMFIESQAKEIFGKLKKEKYLQGLSEDIFSRRLAYYFSEINALHPFREGNGRSQREFIRCLAFHNGYVVHFSRVSREEILQASIESFLCDYGRMEQLFQKCLERKEKKWRSKK